MDGNNYPPKTAWFDMFMFVITGGLWAFYLLFKYLRTH